MGCLPYRQNPRWPGEWGGGLQDRSPGEAGRWRIWGRHRCAGSWGSYPLVTNILPWKITMLLMGKLTISMAMFNSYVTNYQRVKMLGISMVFLRENFPKMLGEKLLFDLWNAGDFHGWNLSWELLFWSIFHYGKSTKYLTMDSMGHHGFHGKIYTGKPW